MIPGFDFVKLMQQSQKFQETLKEMQAKMAEKKVEGESGAGLVRAIVNGKQELLSLTIEDQLLASSDKKFISDLVIAAVNQAMAKSKELMTEEMKGLGQGLGLPLDGLFK